MKEDKVLNVCFVEAVWLVLTVLDFWRHESIRIPLSHEGPCLPRLQAVVFSGDGLRESTITWERAS